MTEDRGEQIIVGRIDAPYGVNGWVRIFSYTEPIERILDYSPWQVVKRGVEQRLVIDAGRRQGRGLIAHPEGYEDRSQAELLAGAEISIEKSRLPKLPEGEYYWHELEGLSVYNEQGDRLGIVDHLIETGGNDVLVVKPDADSVDDRERLVPWVEDRVVRAVRRDEGSILVDWETDF